MTLSEFTNPWEIEHTDSSNPREKKSLILGMRQSYEGTIVKFALNHVNSGLIANVIEFYPSFNKVYFRILSWH